MTRQTTDASFDNDLGSVNTAQSRGIGDLSPRAPQTEKQEVRSAATDAAAKAVPPAPPKQQQFIVEEVQQEVMAHVSPDGRSPDTQSKNASRMILTLVTLGVLGVGAAVTMYFVGGVVALVAGAAYVVILVLAASPVWGAGLLRRHEEHEVKTEVTQAMRQRRRFWWSGSEQ
ncbi:MAG: hypothetical protein H7210_05885 [Pyrinomonadaceae bacterium]|nr:hypothetical protein [Phycisphaerales bacterium]